MDTPRETWILRIPVWILLLGLTLTPGAGAQDRQNVWDGVYSREQADRGRAEFERSCSRCHDDGDRRLDGEEFIERWREDYLVSLFNMIRNGMPAPDPGSLSDQAYIDIVSFLLEMNGFPEGDGELVVDALQTIRVEAEDGPAPVPDSALIEISGCLSEGPDGEWIVSSATTPVRTRNPSASPGEELEALASAPPGNEVFELVYVFPAPEALIGHKVEAKGFLIRSADPDQINVSSLASIAAGCG